MATELGSGSGSDVLAFVVAVGGTMPDVPGLREELRARIEAAVILTFNKHPTARMATMMSKFEPVKVTTAPTTPVADGPPRGGTDA